MKISSFLATPILIGVLALASTGCALFKKDCAPDASKPIGGKAINLLQFRDDVNATRSAINRTGDALTRLPQAPNAQAAYVNYSSELASLNKLAKRTSEESAEVRNGGKALFAQWEMETRSIKNPDISAVADLRRTELQKTYNAMLTPLIDARASLTPLLSDFSDIQKVLALDLTPAGIKAVGQQIGAVNESAAATVKTMDKLALELDKIAAALPPVTVAPVK